MSCLRCIRKHLMNMATNDEQTAKVERFDARIEEIASQAGCADKVKKLGCFLRIRPHTVLSLIVETGDFKRFAKGNVYAAYLGLEPGERVIVNKKSQKYIGENSSPVLSYIANRFPTYL